MRRRSRVTFTTSSEVEGGALARDVAVRSRQLEWRQFRFYCSPGRLLREHGRWVLRVPKHDRLAAVWRYYCPSQVPGLREAPT